MDTKRIAAIDIGSNSVRLLITDVIDYSGKPFFKKDQLIRVPLKLGEDAFGLGYISDSKKENLAILLQSFKGLMHVNGVDTWRVCATSALREASNAEEVVNYIFLTTEMNIEIIDPKEESRYIVLNIAEEAMVQDRVYLFADVGGGSTDMVLYFRNKEIASESFKLGTLRSLNEQQEMDEWEKMKTWLTIHRQNFSKISLIGSGGNINKLDSLLRRCGRIKREELVSFSRKLRSMTPEERVAKYNINLNRATVILPAINIYLKIMKISKVLVIETPIIGVADGIVKDIYMEEMKLLQP